MLPCRLTCSSLGLGVVVFTGDETKIRCNSFVTQQAQTIRRSSLALVANRCEAG